MSLGTNNIEFDSLTADTSVLTNGMLWFRSDFNQFQMRANGTTFSLPTMDDLIHSTAFLVYENGVPNTPLTLNVWNYFDMLTATLDTPTLFEFEQLTGFPDTLVYKGTETKVVRIVSTTGLRRIGGGINTYQMRWVKNGGQIGGVKQFELGGTDGSISMTALVEMELDDQIWLEIRNISDADDVRLLSANITVK